MIALLLGLLLLATPVAAAPLELTSLDLFAPGGFDVAADLIATPGANVLAVQIATFGDAVHPEPYLASVTFRITYTGVATGEILHAAFSFGDAPLLTFHTRDWFLGAESNPERWFSMATDAPCCPYVGHDGFPGSISLRLDDGPTSVHTFGLVDPVPEPATLWLAGSGLGVVAWWRRRR